MVYGEIGILVYPDRAGTAFRRLPTNKVWRNKAGYWYNGGRLVQVCTLCLQYPNPNPHVVARKIGAVFAPR